MEQPTDACERTRHFVWKIVHYCDPIVCMALHACWRRVIVFAAVIQMWVLENRGFAFFSSFVLIGRYRRVQHHGQFPDTPAHTHTPAVTHADTEGVILIM